MELTMINRTCLLGGMLAALVVACGSDSDKGNGSNNGPAGGYPSAGGTGAANPSGGTSATGTGGSGNLGGSSTTGGITNNTGGGGLSACPSFANLPPNSDCGSKTTAASIKKVNTLLVVDKSGSMSDTPPGFDQNKWIALTEALRTVLTDTQRLMAYGLELFPDKDVPPTCINECCQMPGAGNIDVRIPGGVDAILGAFDTYQPGGGTPTAQALRGALNYFTTGAGGALQGQKFVLLATDGGPNCNDSFTQGCAADVCTNNIDGKPVGCDANFNCCDTANGGQPIGCLDTNAAVAAVADLAAANIPTIVLGIPGTESYTAVMDQMADAGGMPDPHGGDHRYYAANAANGVDGLTAKIAEITVQLVQKCELQLDEIPPDPDRVAVALDCTLITRSAGDAGTGDWTLDTTTTPPTVRLLGDTCIRVQTTGVQRLDVLLGCIGPIG
jgi:hypothetical protein